MHGYLGGLVGPTATKRGSYSLRCWELIIGVPRRNPRLYIVVRNAKTVVDRDHRFLDPLDLTFFEFDKRTNALSYE